ncbi:bifunctional riboflavin kinase/FAD synthetase [Methylocapsa palsarum]|uniref:bifunctional riboflavin kinase/FAD synthetase n=1 Tax=Methylocapsa palsarum TaxID=1612308 RepID=UPI003CC7AB0F
MTAPPHAKRFVLAVDPAAPPSGLEGAVIAIGNFDGVHRGHAAVIERAGALANKLGRPCAVLTFEPHPTDFFRGPNTIFRLTPLAAKARSLERLGVDGMIVVPFDAALASLSAEDFVSDVLVRRLGVAAIVAGYDFHFGAHRSGSPDLLKEIGGRRGFPVDIVPPILADSDGPMAASSTATRAALEAGDVEGAARLLGRPYSILGEVIHGQKLGRTLGFPTANLVPDPSCRLRHGVYAVRVEVEGRLYEGAASYGRRPTFDDGPALLEAYLFDFSGDLYGETIEVLFVGWIRPELKFGSAAALIVQMKDDVAQAKDILGAIPPAATRSTDDG